MNPADDKPLDSFSTSPHEERIGELINDFFDRRERGEALSEEDFLALHPEHAADLRQHLQGLHLLDGLGSSARTLPHPGRQQFKGSSAEQPLNTAPVPLPTIPGYDVLKPVGRGGMGLVYKAIQNSTKRVVALKVLLEGPLASDVARKRFEREIALAAQLRHANIIPIYDSGSADGRMYYAMEYVFGLPLIDYLKAHSLDVKSRLQLFLKICSGVSHAHLRGVVHRDLKPSNILIDGNGDPHILDFGLAKAGGLGDMTTSITAQIVGTPAYMSPEQAAGDPSGIDLRTDIYSLGIVLYEMLTERMPYETNVGMGRVLHNIAHAEPLPPSRLEPKVDGELSAIVLKALEKPKEARYQSIDGFSEDVRRYLAGEPISARPASTIYLLKKAVLKHRAAVLVIAMLILVGMGTFWGTRQVIQQEKDHTNERLRIAEEKLTQKEATVQQLQEQQTVESPSTMEEFINGLSPVERKWAKLLYAAAPVIQRQETPVQALAEGAKVLIEDLGEEQRNLEMKKPILDDMTPVMSPRPEDATPTTPLLSDQALSDLARILDAALPKPTTQPTSRPAEPAASQPAMESDNSPTPP